MPKKPTKWGIKCSSLADSSNGYILNVLPYTGRQTLDDASSEHAAQLQNARVVLHLADQYLDQGRHVFTDRYYSSISLAQALKTRATSFTGTMNKNHTDLPDKIQGRYRLADGEVMAFRIGDLLALTWRAEKKKKTVIMLSTNSSAAIITIPLRRASAEAKVKPVVVHTYNQHMNGVDIADKHSTYYSFLRKTVKWWRKLFFWLLETAVVNSYIMHNNITMPRRPDHFAYRRAVVESLASRYLSSAPPRRRLGRPRKHPHPEEDDTERLNKQLHLLDRRTQLHDCVVCSDRAIYTETQNTVFL